MVKRKGDKLRRVAQKTFRIPESETSSSILVHPNATLTPEGLLDTFTTGQLLSRDSTNAPNIGEETKVQEGYAQSQAALLDKYVLSRHSAPFILAIIIIGAIFIQDNGAGKLINWEGIWWTVQKSVILISIVFLLLFCQYLYKKVS